ncbi:MAG TPA: hypothetical protein VLZ83_07455 [Edaphocola sp.]|nr:hypothetical protein [Edaphocola sp.]
MRYFLRTTVIFVGNLIFFINILNAQELYPNAEPSSNIPKGALGLRVFSEFYGEPNGYVKNVSALRLMYGLSPRLSVYTTVSLSNHHKKTLPEDFPYHNTPERGVYKPFLFGGVNVYGKYRFLSLDAHKSHLRMAMYGEGSWNHTAHDEGESRLLDDNKGFGFGYIGTYLKDKFAVSLTVGGIFPGQFKGYQADVFTNMPDIPTRVKYPNTLNYSLSFGYLLLPRVYKDYKQTNINVYLEFMGKSYGDTKVWVTPFGVPEYLVETSFIPPALRKGYYVDIAPGIQFVFNSNTRMDFSVQLPGLKKSYAHLYPQFNFGIQHYFYL